MEDLLLLETIEKYLSNQMDAQEKTAFELVRKNTPEIDQWWLNMPCSCNK